MTPAQFPILANEIRRLSRKGSVYGVRLGVIVLMFLFLAMGAATFSVASSAQLNEIQLYFTVVNSVAGFIGAFALPLVRATDTIASEKRDRTLDLLFLANAKPADIILAKYATVLLESFTVLLSITPIFAMSTYFGGATLTGIVEALTALLLSLLLVSAIGILCSAIAPTPLSARIHALGALAILWLIGYVFATISTTLGWTTTTIGDVFLLNEVLAIAFLIALIPACIYGAIHALQRNPHPKTSAPTKTQRPNRRPSKRPLQPLIHSALNGLALGEFKTPLRLLSILLFAVIAYIPVFGFWLLLFILYWDIASSLQTFTQNGGLDDVRITDATDRELGHAAFRTTAIAALPYLIGMLAGKLAWHGYFWLMDDYITIESAAEAIRIPAAFAALVALATYYGVAQGRRRHTGLYIFYGIAILSSAFTSILYTYLWAVISLFSNTYDTLFFSLMESIQILISALFLAPLAYFTYREIGKHWRSDLTKKTKQYIPNLQPTTVATNTPAD